MEIFSNIVGTHFRPTKAKEICNTLESGDYVDLVAEPNNAYDPMAVAVYADDVHIGYIARQNNHEVSEWLNDGGEVTAKVISREGSKPVLLVTWDDKLK